MNLAVSSRLIRGLTDEMTKGPNIHFLKTNDSKNKEGVSHVKESLDKGQVYTKEAVSFSALFTHTQTFDLEDIRAK